MTLGLEIADGFARAVIVDADANVLARAAHPVSGGAAAAATAALESAMATARVPLTRIGLAVPPHGQPPSTELNDTLRELAPDAGPPLVVPSGQAAAVAEHWCGAARGLSTVVTISTGEHVTSGILIDGRVWRGVSGLAGNIGWLTINPVEREDYRRLGGFEAEVSAGGIVRRIVWRIKSGDRSSLVQQNGGDLSRITAEQVMHGARNGDGLSGSVIRDTARYVGIAVANVAAIVDPQAVVLGGMIAEAGDLLFDPIRHECSRRLGAEQAERLQLLLSRLGSDAAAIGAARLAHAPA